MFGVGRDLCGSSSPTLLPKQGHPEQAAQDSVQAGLEYLQRRRLHNPPWAACSSVLSPSKWRNSSSYSDGTSCASVCALCPLSCHWTPHWKELGPILLTPTLQIFVSTYKVPSQPSLLQAKQAQVPQPFLLGFNNCIFISYTSYINSQGKEIFCTVITFLEHHLLTCLYWNGLNLSPSFVMIV